MTGGSLGLRAGSFGTLQQMQSGVVSQTKTSPSLLRRASKKFFPNSREKEGLALSKGRLSGRRKVAVLFMVILALLVFIMAANFNRENQDSRSYRHTNYEILKPLVVDDKPQDSKYSTRSSLTSKVNARPSPTSHPCEHFAFPPPPPADRRQRGPHPCPVCYVPVEQAVASMPSSPSVSPVLRRLTYVQDENPIKRELHGGSDFGGYHSLEDGNTAFDIKETMKVHCGFVKGSRLGRQTGFDVDEEDLLELDQYHNVIVASAIFGNHDVLQQPKNISEEARKVIPFYMFIDEETEMYMKNSCVLDSSKKVGLWRIIVVHNVPYVDARRNGKVPKLLLHRIFPNVRYSMWIDGKLQLIEDPYQILERFLWRPNGTFAISRH